MSAGIVDLRSDTVTRPTVAMRRAMAEAEVGDDGYGEDPTVNRLEERFAARVGKEAAVFVPSGTMANQIALRLLVPPGGLAVVGARQHVVCYELGAAAVNGWAQFHPVPDDDGSVSPSAVDAAIDAVRHHHPTPAAVFVENTHMPAGGVPWRLDALEAVAARGLPVHLDGARLFNAEVATGVSAAAYAAPTATVMCCLSKGLGAPVGSLLAASADLVAAARVERKRLGGAMRQAGVVAAAGLVALTSMIDRLADDHHRARVLAEAVAQRWPDAGLVPDRVTTNVVVFDHPDPAVLLDHLAGHGVLAGTIAARTVRLMTHLDVDDDGVARAVAALRTAP
ncbi:MAG: aminotransferase class I/II-fold pyridoxal phosphate-dependent enzyme [Acidimicrobiales bacterium]|jgi:threonine aldolase|nr:aminotransferase class I/II-fold pyridoxal phosphate-dependent enzyme [Acidimicrobiales bacterium]